MTFVDVVQYRRFDMLQASVLSRRCAFLDDFRDKCSISTHSRTPQAHISNGKLIYTSHRSSILESGFSRAVADFRFDDCAA